MLSHIGMADGLSLNHFTNGFFCKGFTSINSSAYDENQQNENKTYDPLCSL